MGRVSVKQFVTNCNIKNMCFFLCTVYLHVWEQLTSDREILQLVQGAKLEFTDSTELPAAQTTQPGLNHRDRKIIQAEIEKLAGKKSTCDPRTDQFLLPVFFFYQT